MFVHLRCHSHYSFLRGVNPPEEIIAAAVEQKMPAVALTDTDGMYAAVPFYQAARAAGVKPIVGVVVEVEFPLANSDASIPRLRAGKNGRLSAPFGSAQGRRDDNTVNVSMVLLAADAEGYSNLCQLTTLRHLGVLRAGQDTFAEDVGRAVTVEELEAHGAGVIALWPAGEILRGGSAQTETGRASSAPTEEEPQVQHQHLGHPGENAKAGPPEGGRYTNTSHQPALSLPNGSRVTSHLQRLKEIFGDRLYIEVQHLSAGDGRVLREAQRLGRELGIPLVATNNVHFVKPEEHLHHRAVNAIRTGGLLTTVAAPEITTAEAWFKPAAEMQRLFPDHPELLRATLEIADRCNLELALGKTIFPEFPVPEGESAFSYLWKLSFEGARKRYRPLRPAVLTRLTRELEVIEKWGLAPYFLLVWDIVEEARRRGIPAVARGSAASSMVLYCLGISCVCPLRWGLYFERFLNEQRGDCPDIDIDICGARRDELLDYVYARWGAEHVAMIGSFITMHARLAVREVAKVFGMPPDEVNHFTKRLPHRPVREILEAIKLLPEGRTLPVNDEPWKTILQVALRLDYAPRHLGIHPCGTVISARPLTHLVPLERATKGIVVTQYDMNAIEALGLIKMDLLGQRGLTTMALALDNIEIQEVKEVKEVEEVKDRSGVALRLRSGLAADGFTPCPEARTIDFGAIPENDPATCAVIAAGRTVGLFQIESPAMRSMLRMMGAQTLEQVAIALAIIRPGAAEYGSKELFVKRLRGKEPVVYAHESLKSILGDTLGVCIYQEQVMQIAQTVGSMSLAEADLVRRSTVKYSGRADYERLRSKFEKAAGMMGMTKEERREAWMMVEKFAGFGFCKAHAATYADTSYRMAYLKTHHTAEFLAAMCSAGAGFYHVSAYVEEAKRWGIEMRLPSVNRSRMEYTAEGDDTHCDASHNARRPPQKAAATKAMRIGLMQVKGLRVETIVEIVRAREAEGTFCSLEDFLARVPAERDEIEALIKCGAFDEVCGMTRAAMLWQWNLLQAEGRGKAFSQPRTQERAGQARPLQGGNVSAAGVLFAEMEAEDAIGVALREIDAPDYTREQKLRYEREVLEVCVSGHPLDFLPRNGETWSDELPGMVGKRVTLCGWVVTYRHVGTKNYRNMMFVTLEDQRGLFEVILFPDVYDKYGGLVYETRSMRVTGVVMEGEHVNGERMERLG
ncbi:MAG TPA: DNA polymerase III subunit alpha [Candidatus Sulfotelmatobacter sp.]|jgi:DNA polymerase-3 subunit alpha|nr:DNA polymerase III subunit alpha [Candidatus Sulfotelmatobacter sp.]